MKHIANIIVLSVLLPVLAASAEGEKRGIVPFDFPDLQRPKIEAHLDGNLIRLASRVSDNLQLLDMLDAVHVQGYPSDAPDLDAAVRYYERVLYRRGWETFAKVQQSDAGTVELSEAHVLILLGDEAAHGVFVIVRNSTETFFVNIAGEIDPERIGEVFSNVDSLGINVALPNIVGTDGAQKHPPRPAATPPKRGFGLDSPPSPPLEGCPKDGVGEGWSSGRGGLQEDATQGSGEDTPRSDVVHAANQFVDNEGQSIDEVRVEGNRRVRLSQIKDALEQGPDNIAAATQTMEAILPYVRRANWNIHEEGTRRIATITIEEQDAFSRQFHTVPFITAGFNRVHGFRLGPQFTLQSSSPFDDVPQGRLFGEASYGFSNHKINYKTGGSVSWNLRQRWDLTVSAQVHRLTTTRDADVLPDNGEQVLMALLYGGDFRDYYLREGSEVSLRWAHNNATHALGLTLLTEAHESLQKTTDWSFLRWKSEKEPNLSITAGQMRSVVLSYDFDGRAGEGTSTQGWYHSFSLEQGISAIGSDFHFTRFQAHLRRYQPLGDHGFDARLKIGLSTSDLPIQRQFILGGLGTLRGYDLFEFAGDQMVLANLEYRHKVFGGFFGVLFFDAGKVWDGINTFDAADAKASIGLGIQIDDGWRLNWAQALESGRSVQFHMRWSGMF